MRIDVPSGADLAPHETMHAAGGGGRQTDGIKSHSTEQDPNKLLYMCDGKIVLHGVRSLKIFFK